MKNNLKILSVVLAVLTVMSAICITPVAAKTEYSTAMNATVITADGGKASLSDASSIVNAASKNGDTEVIVNADGHTLNFSISTTALNSLAQAGLNLTVYAKTVKIAMTPKTLTEIASKATGTVVISVNDGATLLDISITSAGAPIELTDRASVVISRATDAGSIVVENDERMAFSYADTEKWGFKLDGSAKVTTKKIESITFADTNAHWSKDNVAFVAANGYFNGVAPNKFAPDEKMTRAMAVTVLSRIDGFKGEAGNIPFGDVGANTWFAPAVSWAAANSIVPAEANFRPDDDITRIELMSMLYHFALKLGITNASEYADKQLDFSDADQIKDDGDKLAALFCTENGIVGGYTSNRGTKTIKASGKATRAEVATMMQRFVKYSVFKGSETVAKAGKYAEAMKKRGDLQNLYNKLTVDKELTVAYFGGSVTAGAGASSSDTSWRGLINTWFKTNFPKADITMIHAAVGGSGSHLGAFRVQEDIIPKKPDLVFTEFVVNDHYSGTVADKKVELYYESIIRQIREALPETEIIAIYVTNNGAYTSSNLKGKYIQAAESQEKVCEAYGITSIDVGRAMALELGSDMIWSDYFTDSVHPADKGYSFYAGVIEEYLNEYLFGAPSFGYGEKRTYTNPDTYVDKRNETFKPIYLPIKSLDIFDDVKGWNFSNTSAGIFHHGGYITPVAADNQLTLTFEGTDVDLFTDISGGYGYTYTVDGGEEKTGRITGSDHPAKCLKNLGEGKHTITFTNTGDSGDGVFEKTRRLGAFLIHGTK